MITLAIPHSSSRQAKWNPFTNQRLGRHVRQEINRAVKQFYADHPDYQIAYENLDVRAMRFRARRMNAYLYASNLAHLPKQILWNAKKRGQTARTGWAAYSSQECSLCHFVSRTNRPDQQTFCCQACGFQLNADENAAINHQHRFHDREMQACRTKEDVKALLDVRHIAYYNHRMLVVHPPAESRLRVRKHKRSIRRRSPLRFAPEETSATGVIKRYVAGNYTHRSRRCRGDRMPMLIVTPRVTPDTEAILAAARAAGWETQRLTTWRVPAELRERGAVVYGEPLFAEVVAVPLGVALLEAPSDWLPALPARYRQRAVQRTTLGAARQYAEEAFIKPADEKCFPAQVYTSGAALPHDMVLPADIAVLISEPVIWEVEYRCFVAERQILTWSPYWRDGALAQAADGTWPAPPDEVDAALTFARTLLADPDVAVPPAFVLDIGRVRGRGWAVVEANSAWGAGIYGCDPAQVLRALQRAVVARATLSSTDARWARTLSEIEADVPPTMPEPDEQGLVTLYRPVGAYEWAKIVASGYCAFPPRLPEQPIFYPVLNERYASEIARAWNTRDAASGEIGYVTRFHVRAALLAAYPVQVAGAADHQEYWIPAEDVDAFNAAIVGPITLTATFERAPDGT